MCLLRFAAKVASLETQVRGFVMRRSMAAFCWLVFLPFSAFGLGLGEIALDSALNEPFSAEIPLDSYEESDLKDLTVQLASKQTFERYGLDQPAFLRTNTNLSVDPFFPPYIQHQLIPP